MKGVLAASAIAATVSPMAIAAAQGANTTPSFNFTEVTAGSDERIHVAEGYDADVLIRWGDKVLPGAPAFDPTTQSAAAQALQFGYNNDFLGYLPIDGSRRGLLVVNHEYTNEELMFPTVNGRQDLRATAFRDMTQPLAEIEMMAHGGSVLEVARGGDGKWAVVENSRFARRITRRDRDGADRASRRASAPAHQRRPNRARGQGHAQQLRRRHHALGHLGDLRGEHQRLFLGPDGREPPGVPQLPPHRRAEPLVQLGRLSRPIRRQQGAERGQPVRLDRRDRPIRPGVAAQEAHRARPLQA